MGDTPAGKVLKAPKYSLVEGNPLIDILKPELVNVVPKNVLSGKFKDVTIDSDDDTETDITEPDDTASGTQEAPDLSDITIVKKEKIRDGNKNDLVRFTINVKNHVGDSVVGVKVYGI